MARASARITLVTRGAHLDAIRTRGLEVQEGAESTLLDLKAIGPEEPVDRQDIVFVTLKNHSVKGAAASIARLCHANTTIVWAMNGIPWWFFHGMANESASQGLDALDPSGAIAAWLDSSRIVGCVIYPSAELVRPGCVRHTSGDRFLIGEPSGEPSRRIETLNQLFRSSGLDARIVPDIRTQIWLKLWGNVAFNPLSVLTGATLKDLATDPGCRRVIKAMMSEAKAVAEAYGAKFEVDMDARMDIARGVGPHRTSMLQDYEAGKPLETAAILDAIIELARRKSLSMPVSTQVQGLLAMKVRVRDRAGIGRT